MDLYPGNKGSPAKLRLGRLSVKETKVSNSGKGMDLKDGECFKRHKKGRYANICPDAKGKDGKGFSRCDSWRSRQWTRRKKYLSSRS